jgi:hypothetical protein
MHERPKRCNASALNAPFKPAQAREVRACWISFLFPQTPHSALIVQWTFLSSFEDSHSPARLDATSTDALPAIAFLARAEDVISGLVSAGHLNSGGGNAMQKPGVGSSFANCNRVLGAAVPDIGGAAERPGARDTTALERSDAADL